MNKRIVLWEPPKLVTDIPCVIYAAIVKQYGAAASFPSPDFMSVGREPLSCPLKGLREDGRHAGIQLCRFNAGTAGTFEAAEVALYETMGAEGLFGDIRLIRAERDTKPRFNRHHLHQEVFVDPNRPGLRLLSTPPALLELAESMAEMAREMSGAFKSAQQLDESKVA